MPDCIIIFFLFQRFSGKGGAAVSFNGSESSPQTDANAQDREAWEVGSYGELGCIVGSSPGRVYVEGPGVARWELGFAYFH